MLVTVIIPTYNAGLLLKEALDSILNQTHKELDIIVIDDGSTDGSVDISYTKDSRVQYAGLSPNQGKSVAMNMGLDLAKGKYVALQDSDDVSLPERIAIQADHLEKHPNLAGVYVSCIWENSNGIRTKDLYRSPKSVFECKLAARRGVQPGHDPCVMYRLDIARMYPYDPNLRIGQGWDVGVRIAEEHELEVLPNNLYIYRPRSTGLSQSDMKRTKEEYLKVYKKRDERRNKK